MKLKVTKKLVMQETVEEAPKPIKKKSKQENTLPPDVYSPMFKPIKLLVKEVPSSKDPTKAVKQYLEFSVKRFDDDEAKPFVWIQMYQESEFYTGYLKGKTVYYPLEMLFDVIECLSDLSEECEKRNIE